jgi:hypothetical protein
MDILVVPNLVAFEKVEDLSLHSQKLKSHDRQPAHDHQLFALNDGSLHTVILSILARPIGAAAFKAPRFFFTP